MVHPLIPIGVVGALLSLSGKLRAGTKIFTVYCGLLGVCFFYDVSHSAYRYALSGVMRLEDRKISKLQWDAATELVLYGAMLTGRYGEVSDMKYACIKTTFNTCLMSEESYRHCSSDVALGAFINISCVGAKE